MTTDNLDVAKTDELEMMRRVFAWIFDPDDSHLEAPLPSQEEDTNART